MKVVIFALDGQRYAVHLESVERVVRVAEITPLPGAPAIVLGVLDVGGTLVPIIDLRRRFGLGPRALRSTDQILIAKTPARPVGLLVDSTEGLLEASVESLVDSGEVLPHLEQIEGVIRLADGIVLIHDLGRCLSLEEEKVLADAMEAGE